MLFGLFGGGSGGTSPKKGQDYGKSIEKNKGTSINGIIMGKGNNEQRINGNFDPTALERGAKALRELDSSPNAQKAFEIVKLQEKTRQKELEKEIEESNAYRARTNLERVKLEGEERRKTLTHQQEEERITAQYKAKLETEAYQKKLKEQEKQNDKLLQQQHSKFLEQEEIRKSNEREILDMRKKQLDYEKRIEQDNIRVRVREEVLGKIRLERENADIHMDEIKLRSEESRKTRIDSIKAIFNGFAEIGGYFSRDRSKIGLLVGGITSLAFGIYSAKNGVHLATKIIETKIDKPSLIRETNLTLFSRYKSMIPTLGVFQKLSPYLKRTFVERQKVFENVVLSEDLEERLRWTINTLVNSRKYGIPYRNMLFWGKPGTGKTMFAKKLAKESGLDYAIMSGGDVGPLGKNAVSELNKVFDWARRSKRNGLLLFIDEAESFLSKGREHAFSNMSQDTKNILSSFLHQTGTESKDVCVLLATNIPNSLDNAVLDRIDECFEFPNPGFSERLKIIKMFLNKHFVRNRNNQFSNYNRKDLFSVFKKKYYLSSGIEIHSSIDENFLSYLAEKTRGFSGRQLSKLVLSMKSIVLGSGINSLTRDVAETALKWKLKNFNEESDDFEFNPSSF
ncbi:26S proteosome regulatory subunit [Cryptosporidium bovis]|uniref:26S proteosome regulatory subunit n=1 Tax=Cryptosporidium bovis TaxID=310047 RepID=UPI00351A01A0|nr:26S proteosome regulatory subunit [Cryptosporidium bovis]